MGSVRVWVGRGCHRTRGRGHASATSSTSTVPERLDLQAYAHDLLPCLREKLALLALEEAACRTKADDGWCRREEGHELVASGWGRVFSARREDAFGVDRDVDI